MIQVPMLEVQQIYCFEPDKDNINFLKNKFKNEINNGLIIPIEIGIYYGLKENRFTKYKKFLKKYCI